MKMGHAMQSFICESTSYLSPLTTLGGCGCSLALPTGDPASPARGEASALCTTTASVQSVWQVPEGAGGWWYLVLA